MPITDCGDKSHEKEDFSNGAFALGIAILPALVYKTATRGVP
jgi:hypothetical protein